MRYTMKSILAFAIIMFAFSGLTVFSQDDEFKIDNQTDSYMTVLCNYETEAGNVADTVFDGYKFAKDNLADETHGYIYLYISILDTDFVMIFRCKDENVRRMDGQDIETFLRGTSYVVRPKSEFQKSEGAGEEII